MARKLPLDGGAVVGQLLDEIDHTATAAQEGNETLHMMGAALASTTATVRAATLKLLERLSSSPADAFAGATPYLRMLGQLAGGWTLVRQALAAQRRIDGGDTDERLAAKIVTAGFYCEQLLPLAGAQESAVLASADALMTLREDQF